MSKTPSIVIPCGNSSDQTEIQKKKTQRGGYPFLSTDKSFWSLAVYEIWDSQKIQKDLISNIENITTRIQNYRRFQTYSKKEYIELSEKRIVEGVCILWMRGEYEKAWKMIPLLQKLSVEIRYFNLESKIF